MKTHQTNQGFAALVLTILISATMLAVVLENTNTAAYIFDEVNRREYRLSAIDSVLSCLDTAVLEITHDYFYTASNISYPANHCSIVSVDETIGTVNGSGYRTITVSGFSANVTTTIVAQVLLSDQKISLLSEMTYF